MVLGGIKTFIIEKVIKAGITWLIAFLNPAAAFIKACKAIYDIVMFIVERGQRDHGVRQLDPRLDRRDRQGQRSAIVAEKVEDSLAKALPLAISFLASLLGLGGISEKIQSVIDKVRRRSARPSTSSSWARSRARRSCSAAPRSGSRARPRASRTASPAPTSLNLIPPPRPIPQAEHEPEGFKATVTLAGAQHEIEATPDGAVTMASANKGGLLGKAQARLNKVKTRDPKPEDEIIALERIIEIVRDVQTHSRKGKPDAPNPKWDQACRDLIVAVAQYGDRFNHKDIDPSGEPERDINELYAQCTHVPPSQYSRAKHWKGASEKERITASDENGQFMWAFDEARVAELEKETLLTGDVDWRGDDAVHAYKTLRVPGRLREGEEGPRASRRDQRQEDPLASALDGEESDGGSSPCASRPAGLSRSTASRKRRPRRR